MTTRTELAEKMLKLAYDMQDVAIELDYYGGLSEWSQKSRDLMAAASWVKHWGQEMIQDDKAVGFKFRNHPLGLL